ncbi:hypothetical protein FOZ60_012711 [Perkinsus olseni]|uniref:SWIM-type domain-containing protein n=1 Tax=Perkinsus olseni TaxID=32597 RepID=A0A7J6NAW9_PEROL|nr:hypothetical protein FOZ60_012711 [Perkinsus olseni]
MAIVDEECYEIYLRLLELLNMLIESLTAGERSLKDVVNLCVHDAHQGALKACKEYLPDVKRHKYFLHASPTTEIYLLLSEALITAVEDRCERGGRYLRNTLNPEQYGYPNIELTSDGLIGMQVLTNIVETFHQTQTRSLAKKHRLNISAFAARIRKVIQAMKRSSPQHFVERPQTISTFQYGHEMKVRGTKLRQRNMVNEVTMQVCDLTDEELVSRYFIVDSHRLAPTASVEETFLLLPQEREEAVDVYLKAILLSEFLEGAPSLETVMRRYFCFYLVTCSPITSTVRPGNFSMRCTCKEFRDWGCCSHSYATEIALGTQPVYVPGTRQLPRLRRGRPHEIPVGPLGRFDSLLTAADSDASSDEDIIDRDVPHDGEEREAMSDFAMSCTESGSSAESSEGYYEDEESDSSVAGEEDESEENSSALSPATEVIHPLRLYDNLAIEEAMSSHGSSDSDVGPSYPVRLYDERELVRRE